MVALLKWGVCKENLCLSLEELTVKRHSYLGGFVPSHTELQEMVLKYTHFSVGNLGELTCISHVSSAGKGHCGFPSPLWTARLWIELCSRVWRGKPLSSAEALWGSLPADVGDGRFPLVFRRWLAINSIPPQHGPSGDSTSLWCRTRASSGSPAWKTERDASGENEEMQTLYVSCYCKRMDPESYVRKKFIFHSGCKYFCHNSCG